MPFRYTCSRQTFFTVRTFQHFKRFSSCFLSFYTELNRCSLFHFETFDKTKNTNFAKTIILIMHQPKKLKLERHINMCSL
jgi:hypothetical protein